MEHTEVKLEPWERLLYQAGYRSALAEAGRVVLNRAKEDALSPASDALTSAALEIVRLGDICDADDAVQH